MSIAGWALRHCFRWYERSKASGDSSAGIAPDGLPLPPSTLRFRVAGTAGAARFLQGGKFAAETVRELLAEAGRPIEQCRAILDFGCGCGRVLRRWKNLAGTKVYGTDFNAELADWCRQWLPFSAMSVNSLEPPTAFQDQQFDAIYAFSVFTHIPAEVQKHWLQEFHRILQPGGLLIFSTHGSYYAPRLRESERRRFQAGDLVVRFGSAAGSNLCSAYHSEAFVRSELARGWEIAAFRPQGARGNPQQDAWVFRRP